MKFTRTSVMIAMGLAVGAALVLSGCGKGEQTSAPEPTEGQTPGPTMQQTEKQQGGEQETTSEQKKSEDSEKEKSSEEEKKKAEEEQQDGGQKAKMVTLNAELPKPMFAGTPSDLKTPILEPDPDKQRDSIKVPEGATTNIAKGKPAKAKGTPIMGELSYITDDDKSGRSGTVVTLGPGKQWVQVDLKKKYKIYGVLVWHYHRSARVYHDVVAQVSTNKDFVSNVTTIFNNDQDNSAGLGVGEHYEYIEDNQGRWMPADGVKGRYVRLYSSGSTANELNHYVEVAVYGTPVK